MKRLLFLVASLAFCFSAAAQIDAQKAAAEAAKALEEAPKVDKVPSGTGRRVVIITMR